ncbi:unnamed protein product [Rotaria sp. Silwood1]|nr:unnamed protein product [Rotaria sp. Silwood1]
MISILKSMANVYKASSEYRQALEYYQKLLGLCMTEELAEIHMEIGFCYSELNEMEMSFESYQLARSMCAPINYELWASIHKGLGKYYVQCGNNTEAINNLETALNTRLLCMQTEDSPFHSLYLDLGYLYLESERYQEAEKAFEQLLNKQIEQDEQMDAINTLALLGLTQVRQNNVDKGIDYYQNAFQLSLSMSPPDYRTAAYICAHMGEAYDLDYNPWKCVISYEKTIEMVSKTEPCDNDLLELYHENAQVARQNILNFHRKIAEQEATETDNNH